MRYEQWYAIAGLLLTLACRAGTNDDRSSKKQTLPAEALTGEADAQTGGGLASPSILHPEENILLSSSDSQDVVAKVASPHPWSLAIGPSREGIEDMTLICRDQSPDSSECNVDFSAVAEGAWFLKLIYKVGGVTRVTTASGAVEKLSATDENRAPFIKLDDPDQTRIYNAGTPVEIRWDAVDLEGNDLKVTLAVSSDRGGTWTELATNLTNDPDAVYSWQPAGNGPWLVRATADDGQLQGNRTIERVFIGRTSFQETAGAILQAKCVSCHTSSAEKPPKNLVLDSCESIPQVDASGNPVLREDGTPQIKFRGAKERRGLIVEHAVTYDRLPVMPPPGVEPLTEVEKDILYWWAQSNDGQCTPSQEEL